MTYSMYCLPDWRRSLTDHRSSIGCHSPQRLLLLVHTAKLQLMLWKY